MKDKKFCKRLMLLVMTLLLVLSGTSLAVWAAPAAPPATSAAAVVVMEQSSGRVLHSSNMNAELYPASTTKIMTALLTLENMELDDKITLPQN